MVRESLNFNRLSEILPKVPRMAPAPRFQTEPWPPVRNLVLDVLAQHRPHTVYGFGEADVTETLEKLRRFSRAAGVAVSLNAFVAYCIVQAAVRHPEVLTHRKGRKLIRFEDVDLGTLMDRRVANGALVPTGCILRRAQEKSLAELNWQFREATKRGFDLDPSRAWMQRLARMPGFVHRAVVWFLNRNPISKARLHGTIGLTSLNRASVGWRYHALPPNPHTCSIALGGIYEQADPAGGAARRMLAVSIGLDHAVLDGIPMVQFSETLGRLIEGGAGLDERFVEQTKELKESGGAGNLETDGAGERRER